MIIMEQPSTSENIQVDPTGMYKKRIHWLFTLILFSHLLQKHKENHNKTLHL